MVAQKKTASKNPHSKSSQKAKGSDDAPTAKGSQSLQRSPDNQREVIEGEYSSSKEVLDRDKLAEEQQRQKQLLMSLISKVPKNDTDFIYSEASNEHLIAHERTIVGFLLDKVAHDNCAGDKEDRDLWFSEGGAWDHYYDFALNLAGHGANGDAEKVHSFIDYFRDHMGMSDYRGQHCCFLLPLQNKELIVLFGVTLIPGELDGDGGYYGMLGLNPDSPLVKIENFEEMFLYTLKTTPERSGRLLIPSLKLFESQINGIDDVDRLVGPKGSEKMSDEIGKVPNILPFPLSLINCLPPEAFAQGKFFESQAIVHLVNRVDGFSSFQDNRPWKFLGQPMHSFLKFLWAHHHNCTQTQAIDFSRFKEVDKNDEVYRLLMGRFQNSVDKATLFYNTDEEEEMFRQGINDPSVRNV